MSSDTTQLSVFPCTQCGLCCRHVYVAAETQFLDRGDGTCRHFDATNKGCTIYAERPDICRVDRQYAVRYAQQYTWDEYVTLNQHVCAILQAKEEQAVLQTIKVLPVR
ncbi:YkgJ family cysteine cluster protein [Pseudomonas sp. RTB3]|nr:YkgJ family cysteine cluster protein [Pseudomonas sp. 5B4]MEB0007246.1 YkgJ family cysteine cluster protein [Pseudomonas sp. RTB2]MEB0019429.1 YkgJ family cysteine cluster protein [Pseudomonas sp. RTB3]MEB0270414.1 YkgJ family cysteine cluster protein [Pseudomonas sp. 5B4]